MQLPGTLLNSLNGTKGFDKESFEKVHAIPEQITSVRVNPFKRLGVSCEVSVVSHEPHISHLTPGTLHQPVPWSQHGYYLSKRPSFTFDPLFHAGCYYVQEASSMFLEQALKQTVDLSKTIKVLDLCAAPGGKSTHIQSLITKDSLLVSNEVIKSRANVLKDNIIKWGNDNVVVTNNDPADFGKLENYFDVIVIDAPCSGSGLFRRDEEAMTEWSLNNVALCSQRQQRILADVWPALKPGGVLIYSTCSYSKDEDEEIIDWISVEFEVSSLQLAVENSWGITETVSDKHKSYGYRFWPDKIKGEGFFISCFRKIGDDEKFSLRTKNKITLATKKDISVIRPWVEETDHVFITHNNIVYAIPAALIEDVNMLLAALRVQYSGIIVGEIFGDKLVPAHALALSNLVSKSIPFTVPDYENAIQYLRKKEFYSITKDKGWQLVNYEGYFLGWVNVLSNRVNNYYPKELRILKDS